MQGPVQALDRELLRQYARSRDTKNTDIFCHAPFVSLNFDQSGRVTHCCYNRTQVLGRFPADSIRDMWSGRVAGEFREQMRRNELPDGCGGCANQLECKNFGGLKARTYDSLAEREYPVDGAGTEPMPKVMEFELSNVCNLECVMCNGHFSSAIRSNREHLPRLKNPYNQDFLEQLEEFIPHLKEARFLGGEPFLVKTYYEIWDRIIRMNPTIPVSITTNGTILTTRAKGVLEQLRAHIIVSMDSLDPVNYERIRVNAKFETVMAHIEYFQDYVKRKGTCLTFAVCPMQQNWRDLPRLVEFCNEEGIELWFNTVTQPVQMSLSAMEYSQLGEVVEHLRATKLPEDTPRQRANKVSYLGLISQLVGWQIAARRMEELASPERDRLLGLFAQHEKREDGAPESRLINDATEEVLKRLANDLSYGRQGVDQDEESRSALTASMVELARAHDKYRVVQRLATMEQVPLESFLDIYFAVIRAALGVLHRRRETSADEALWKKLDDVHGLVASFPDRERIVRDLLDSDPAVVIKNCETLPTDELKAIVTSRYG